MNIPMVIVLLVGIFTVHAKRLSHHQTSIRDGSSSSSTYGQWQAPAVTLAAGLLLSCRSKMKPIDAWVN